MRTHVADELLARLQWAPGMELHPARSAAPTTGASVQTRYLLRAVCDLAGGTV